MCELNKHITIEDHHFLMGKLTRSGHFQQLCQITRGQTRSLHRKEKREISAQTSGDSISQCRKRIFGGKHADVTNEIRDDVPLKHHLKKTQDTSTNAGYCLVASAVHIWNAHIRPDLYASPPIPWSPCLVFLHPAQKQQLANSIIVIYNIYIYIYICTEYIYIYIYISLL